MVSENAKNIIQFCTELEPIDLRQEVFFYTGQFYKDIVWLLKPTRGNLCNNSKRSRKYSFRLKSFKQDQPLGINI